jgi:hypothetical protein
LNAGRRKAAAQRQVQIRPLRELFALNAQQCQSHGIETQLLLLDRPHIDLADPKTRLRQFEGALVVSHGALE